MHLLTRFQDQLFPFLRVALSIPGIEYNPVIQGFCIYGYYWYWNIIYRYGGQKNLLYYYFKNERHHYFFLCCRSALSHQLLGTIRSWLTKGWKIRIKICRYLPHFVQDNWGLNQWYTRLKTKYPQFQLVIDRSVTYRRRNAGSRKPQLIHWESTNKLK